MRRCFVIGCALFAFGLLAGGALLSVGDGLLERDISKDVARSKQALAEVAAATVTIGSREHGAAFTPHAAKFGPFWLGRYEVTVAEYACYLNETRATSRCPDLVCRGGRWRPRWGRARYPVTHVSRSDAESFCRWLSAKWGQRVRLPTESEWERAARGNIHGTRYPWGWGPPARYAQFAAAGPARVGRYPPNALGLYDMAGNVYEWCADRREDESGVVRGGSWAERDPAALRVCARAVVKADYRDRDVGFRILVEVDDSGEK